MAKRILVVEYNFLFRRFLETILPKYCGGYDFIFAESAVSAKQKIENVSDLYCLVTDYDLGAGQTNGIQLAEDIKNEFSGVKIVLISLKIDADLKNEAHQHGIDNYFLKFDELYRWIKSIEL